MATEALERVTPPVVVTKQSPTATRPTPERYTSGGAQKQGADASVTCARCGADVGPDALYRLGQGYHAQLYCAACAGAQAPWPDWRPRSTVCRSCGRRLYYWGSELWPHHYCTESCERAARRERRRRPRRVSEGACARCGTRFKATRVDARYCSPACRQKAYRQRQRLEAPA